MGYGSCEKGYRIYNLQTKKIILSRSVVFDESKSWNWESKQEETVFMPLSFENENPEITEPEWLIHETQMSGNEHVTGSNNGSTSQTEKLGRHLCQMSYDYY
ncbi:retrovirus-related Pol polyprotein from transposon TNT 1-94 [Pyrus ussuriensis x Pyrus communis]|uniref:Retrovirus-related Pol polyprotein from transposon TNT 1-94 n=1 Tax=Pyrus ussuriensis x Pyrus communis TaxID=2448454 RepID=A0A5N5HNN8_9ROSA|nr:retrovirus-related Pol polyprotein from transposon TNT 1-94 [Pyrus ussuriensis x Pyrus communis]